jgi:hypothetical protein
MVASIVIIVLSLGLLVYWLRATCVLLLGQTEKALAWAVPLFAFPRVRTQVDCESDGQKLIEALDRDYAVLMYLLRGTRLADLEARLLVWDYRLMRCWYALASTAFPPQGRRALEEMADVRAVLATKLRAGTAQTT